MITIAHLSEEMQRASCYLSTQGNTEYAALHESVNTLAGYLLIDGREINVVSESEGVGGRIDLLPTERILDRFADCDTEILVNTDSTQAIIYFMVGDEGAFENTPIFLQNYLAADMLPMVFGIFIELIGAEVDTDRERFVVHPYFQMTSLKGEFPGSTLGYVGYDLRQEVLATPDVVEARAMGDVKPFLKLGADFFQGP